MPLSSLDDDYDSLRSLCLLLPRLPWLVRFLVFGAILCVLFHQLKLEYQKLHMKNELKFRLLVSDFCLVRMSKVLASLVQYS